MSEMQLQTTQSKAPSLISNDLISEFQDSVNVRQEILRMPVLRLTQALSDAFKNGLAKQGDFICEITGKNYGQEITIIPLLIRESASLLDKKTSEVICRSNDLVKNVDGIQCSNCPHNSYWADWGTSNTPPACKVATNVVCLVNDDETPVLFALRKMSHKAGKNLANYTKFDPRRVPFGTKYQLSSKFDKKDKYEFYIVNPAMGRQQLTDDELARVIPIARKLKDLTSRNKVIIADDTDDEDLSNDLPI